MKLWLIPASDGPATENITKTLSHPISDERRQHAGLTVDDEQHAWGARAGEKNDRNLPTIDDGDLCLFYTATPTGEAKRYNWAAEAAGPARRSPELSQAFWDTPAFEWVYFLREPRPIALSVSTLASKLRKYRHDFPEHPPQGIRLAGADVVEGILGEYPSLKEWLHGILVDDGNSSAEFLAVLRRYHADRTVFRSSEQQARYAIHEVDNEGCSIRRLDANENARCTTNLFRAKLQLLEKNGGKHPFDPSFDSTSAVRNCLLQSPRLALSGDRKTIIEAVDDEVSLRLFCEALVGLRVDESSGRPKLYKPAMIAALLDAIAEGDLTENRITFDFVAPRFIQKMAALGEQVTEQEAAMPFVHLAGDLFWLLSYNDLAQLVDGGSEGPAAVRAKISHASLKDTFWNVLKDTVRRGRATKAIAEKWWPSKRLPRFWVEKTLVSGRSDRLAGDHALGRALWSPQTAEGGRRIYDAMLAIQPGDIVFHFVDNERIDSFSIAAAAVDPSFVGLAGTDWADRPAYRVELNDHRKLVPPIERSEFLGDGIYRARVQRLLDTNKGLFFNREFNLNQGSYITEAPPELVAIWNEIYLSKTGSSLSPDWNFPFMNDNPAAATSTTRYWKIAPGRDASNWAASRDGGFIAIGWDELGDLANISREQFVQRRDELLQEHGWKAEGVEQAWRFKDIAPGDRIIANRGTDQVLGIGTVIGPYYFVQGEPYGHRLPVRWDDIRPRAIQEGGWRKTLIQVDAAKFAQICESSLMGAPPRPSRENQPNYTLAECSKDTGIDKETLERWIRALERKGQAIFYGPPGTGKTFIAEKLAKYLVGGTDGLRELVQFHPAYSYEDFMQGIRPQTAKDGSLAYPMAPGRFMEFCVRAAERTSPCVLIIDEINRANLSRVFGELMYLLEYRDQEIPLAGGGMFRIPTNVRLIGTMNTADRSIALVDHALRRRFTFISLQPDYDLLERFHQNDRFDAKPLIRELKLLNAAIDDPNYSVGITYFLQEDLERELPDIWQMEIEPYLEELLFDQRAKFEQFKWTTVGARLFP